jgi:hypothetical protein
MEEVWLRRRVIKGEGRRGGLEIRKGDKEE